MADLSAYIDFSARIDAVGGTITLDDTGVYPVGVQSGIRGWFDVTQPDGVTIRGSELAPSVIWNGSQLTHAYVGLRLAEGGCVQNGTYIIKYTVTHPSYDNTVLTRTATFVIPQVTKDVRQEFDVFTPDLKVKDYTVYVASGFSVSVVHNWMYDIVGVAEDNMVPNGTDTLSLQHGGEYYDAMYLIEHTPVVTYVSGTYPWLSVVSAYPTEISTYAQSPGQYSDMLARLECMKNKVDAAASSCKGTTGAQDAYTYAESLFAHLIELIKAGDPFSGEVYESFIAATSECGSSTYEPLNAPILPFDLSQVVPTTNDVIVENVGGQVPLYRNSFGTNPKTLYFRTVSGSGILQAELVGDYVRIRYANKDIFSSDVDASRTYLSGTLIEKVVVNPSTSLSGFKIGVTPGGEEIVFSQPVAAGSFKVFTIENYAGSPLTLYFGGVTSTTNFIVFVESAS